MLAIVTRGFSRTSRRLVQADLMLRSMKGTNELAGAVTLRWIDKNFRSEGALTGQRWAPLTAGTIRRRRKGKNKNFKGRIKILQDVGHLKRNWKVLATADKVIVESQMPYARQHHEGDRSKRLPARPILPEAKHIMPQLQKIYMKKIRTAIR